MKKVIGVILTFLFAASVNAGDATKGKAKTGVCAGCHNADGNSPLAINPKIAGQGAKYLAKQLHDFKSGARENATMKPMADMLSDEDIQNVAAFYATQKVQHMAVEEKFIEPGQKLYRDGDADRDVPACIACHGPSGNGMPSAGFPALGGQHAEYTKAQLLAFRDGKRDNDANNVMRDVVRKMSDEQIEAISKYLAGLH